MGTLATLKSRIATEIHRTDLTTNIADAIVDAVQIYQGRRFAFNQRRATFGTVDGREFYATTDSPATIPTDIGEIDSLLVTVGTRKSRLEPWTYDYMEERASATNTENEPSAYAWYANQLRLYPVPDAVYTMTISYLQKVVSPATDGTNNIWTTEAEALIRHCAKKVLYRDVIVDPEGAAICAAAEADEYMRLKKDAQQLSTGSMRGSW